MKNVTLNDVPLPLVDEVTHLGSALEPHNMSTDIGLKRKIFIGKINSLMKKFKFSTDEVMMKLLNFIFLTFSTVGSTFIML